MEPIISGSTAERIVRLSAVTLMVLAFAGWCFYDGCIRYPLKNLERAVEGLNPPPEVSQELIDPGVNAKSAATIEAGKEGVFLNKLEEQFGEPGWRGQNAKGKNEARYFGPAGQIILTMNTADRVTARRYEPARFKNAGQLAQQKWIGGILAVLGSLLLLHWLRVVALKARMTDEGVKLPGRPLVPFDAMTEMHAERYEKKGWLRIDYELDGRQDTLRLDDYKIKAFPAILAETCRRKGWEDPYQKWQEKKNAPRSASE